MKSQDQSQTRIVQAPFDLKTWLERTPTVEQARPGQCPACQAPSRPLGGPLGLWGHGLRPRQQRGPLDPEGPPKTVVVAARRYLCLRCEAIILVVPRGVLPRRHYAASAIALALALWGLLGMTVPTVRQRVSPWQLIGAAAASGWASLRRWVQAIRRGTLFPFLRACPKDFSLRQVAQRAAATLCAFCVPSMVPEPPQVCAFLGGMRMA